MARQNPLQFFLEGARKYGDVVSMQLGFRRVYLVSHPNHIKYVLQDNHHAYYKSPLAARVRNLEGSKFSVGVTRAA